MQQNLHNYSISQYISVAAVGTGRSYALVVVHNSRSEVETISIQVTLHYSWFGLLEVTALASRTETHGLNLTFRHRVAVAWHKHTTHLEFT